MKRYCINSIVVATLVGVSIVNDGCRRAEQTPHDRNAIGAAWQQFCLGEFAGASTKFNRVLAEGGPSEESLRVEAEYGFAWIAGFESDSNEGIARAMFEQIAITSHQSPWAGWSRLAIVRLAQQSDGTETSDARNRLIKAYGAVVTDFPGSLAGDEAYVYQQSVRLISLNPDDAREVAKDLADRIDRHESHFVSALYDLRSTAYRLSGQFKESLADAMSSVETSETDPQNPAPVDATKLYSIAVMAQYDVGDFATARRFYRQFLDQYPTDPRSFTVHQLLNDMEKTAQALQQASAKELQ